MITSVKIWMGNYSGIPCAARLGSQAGVAVFLIFSADEMWLGLELTSRNSGTGPT